MDENTQPPQNPVPQENNGNVDADQTHPQNQGTPQPQETPQEPQEEVQPNQPPTPSEQKPTPDPTEDESKFPGHAMSLDGPETLEQRTAEVAAEASGGLGEEKKRSPIIYVVIVIVLFGLLGAGLWVSSILFTQTEEEDLIVPEPSFPIPVRESTSSIKNLDVDIQDFENDLKMLEEELEDDFELENVTIPEL